MCKTQIDIIEDHGGHKGSCVSCPFNDNLTEEASQAQDYGCLPSGYDIIKMKRRTGHNWACHDDENKVCAGLCHAANPKELDLSQGDLVRYSSWYRVGEEAALEEASTGVLVEMLTGPQFERATCGERMHDGAFMPPWLKHPDGLKYYAPHSILSGKDTRVLFVASRAATDEDDVKGMVSRDRARIPVGIAELQVSPYEDDLYWLMYVTVGKDHQGKGIARRLVELMAQHVAKDNKRLQRSTPSEEGKLKLQACVDRILDENFVRWTQPNRR